MTAARGGLRRGRLAFAIHELNSWMGQERCTLELASRLSHRWPVDVYAFALEDQENAGWGDMRFHRIPSPMRHPELLRTLLYYACTVPLLLASSLRTGGRPLVHAAGACSLVSDVIQVHFVHTAWREKRRDLPEPLRLPPRAVSGGGPASWMLRLYYGFLLRFNILTEKITFRQGKTYVAISRRIAEELKDHFGLEENVHVIHHGVDAQEFRPVDEESLSDRRRVREEFRIGADDVTILFVGAYDRKGLDTAIRTLALLDPSIRGTVRLLAIGAGNRDRYERLAREQGVEDRVILAGPRREISRYYRASDLFLFPTLYEPFGLVIIEAMACGLPVVASRAAGASELIEDEVSGFLLDDPSDPVPIAALLERLVPDERCRREIGRRAREVAQLRTWQRVARAYESVLEPLLVPEGRP